jgi:hypothetical protein
MPAGILALREGMPVEELAEEYVIATFEGEDLGNPRSYRAEEVWRLVYDAYAAGYSAAISSIAEG